MVLTVLFHDQAKDFGVLFGQFSSRTLCSLRVTLRDAHNAVVSGEYFCPRATVFRVDGLDHRIGVVADAEGDNALLDGVRSVLWSETSNGCVDQQNRLSIDFNRRTIILDDNGVSNRRGVARGFAACLWTCK